MSSRVEIIEEQVRIIIKASFGMEGVLTPAEQVIYDEFIRMSKWSEALLCDEDLGSLMCANEAFNAKYSAQATATDHASPPASSPAPDASGPATPQ